MFINFYLLAKQINKLVKMHLASSRTTKDKVIASVWNFKIMKSDWKEVLNLDVN